MPDQAAYPSPPWRLTGTMYTSLWRLPQIPASWRLPDGLRPAKMAGRYLLTTAWVDYREGGVLQYRELICSLQCRRGLARPLTVVMAWVDSPVSLAGGRELWGIPKQLGTFELTHQPAFSATLRPAADADVIASATGRHGRRLPGRWRVPGRFVQQIGGEPRPVRQLLRGRLSRATIRYTVSDDGPLACLAGRRPLASLVISDFEFIFGTEADRRSPAEPGAARVPR